MFQLKRLWTSKVLTISSLLLLMIIIAPVSIWLEILPYSMGLSPFQTFSIVRSSKMFSPDIKFQLSSIYDWLCILKSQSVLLFKVLCLVPVHYYVSFLLNARGSARSRRVENLWNVYGVQFSFECNETFSVKSEWKVGRNSVQIFMKIVYKSVSRCWPTD